MVQAELALPLALALLLPFECGAAVAAGGHASYTIRPARLPTPSIVCVGGRPRGGPSAAARQFIGTRFGTAPSTVPPSPDQQRARRACRLLEARLRMDESDLRRLLEATPTVLDLTEEQLVPTLDFLARYVGDERLSDFVRTQPQSLLWKAEGMSPVAQHLRAFGVSDKAIQKATNAFPAVTRLVSATNLDALLCYLQDELGLSVTQLGKLIAGYPQLLGLSLQANVRPTADFFEELGANSTRMISRHPQLLGLSLESNLRPTVHYLQSIGVDVGRAINVHPALLSLGLERKAGATATTPAPLLLAARPARFLRAV